MNKKVITLTLLLSSIVGIASAFQSPKWQLFSAQLSRTQSSSIVGEIGTYASYSLEGTEEDLYAVSDMVFVGQVLGFGPSIWNRDNNTSPSSVEEWESTPSGIYHHVKIRVAKPILGAKVGQVINVNVRGSSPVRSTVKIGQGSFFTVPEDSNLKIGSKGIFLVTSRGKGAWISASGRAFLKTMTTFSGTPDLSYLPEKNGTYMKGDQPVTLETIQSKVSLYTPAREKYFRNLPVK